MRIKWLIAMLLALSLMLAGCGQASGNTAMDTDEQLVQFAGWKPDFEKA